MKHHEDVWGWKVSVYFLFGGMDGGILAVAAITDLFIGPGRISLVARMAGPVLVAIGSGLLLLDLGRPFQGWRVFVNRKSILTFGSWCLTLAMMIGAVEAGLHIPAILRLVPWFDHAGLLSGLSVALLILGLAVAGYPGVLLARQVGRPFWTGPGIVVLFVLSSLVTGVAAHQLSNSIWPPQEAGVAGGLRWVASAMLAFQGLLWILYLYVKRTGATKREEEAARRWLTGSMAPAFWLGVFGCGSLLPLVFQLWAPDSTRVAPALVLVGAAVMRYLVVRSGEERTWIEGEQAYNSRLPRGDEAFLRAWNKS